MSIVNAFPNQILPRRRPPPPSLFLFVEECQECLHSLSLSCFINSTHAMSSVTSNHLFERVINEKPKPSYPNRAPGGQRTMHSVKHAEVFAKGMKKDPSFVNIPKISLRTVYITVIVRLAKGCISNNVCPLQNQCIHMCTYTHDARKNCGCTPKDYHARHARTRCLTQCESRPPTAPMTNASFPG